MWIEQTFLLIIPDSVTNPEMDPIWLQSCGFLPRRKVALSLMIMEVSLDTWCWTQMCFPIKVTGSVWIEPNKRLWWDYFDHVYVQLKDARYVFGLWTQTRNLTVLAVFCGEPFDGSSQIYKSCDKIAKMALNILGGGSLVSVEKNVEILPLPNNGFIKFGRRYSTILRPKASWEKAMLKMEVGGLMGLDFFWGTKHFHWCFFFEIPVSQQVGFGLSSSMVLLPKSPGTLVQGEKIVENRHSPCTIRNGNKCCQRYLNMT